MYGEGIKFRREKTDKENNSLLKYFRDYHLMSKDVDAALLSFTLFCRKRRGHPSINARLICYSTLMFELIKSYTKQKYIKYN